MTFGKEIQGAFPLQSRQTIVFPRAHPHQGHFFLHLIRQNWIDQEIAEKMEKEQLSVAFL